MKKLKIILTSLFTMMMVACLSLGITSIVSAEVTPPKTTAFEVVDGASIRLSDPTGLRFQIKLGQAEYETLTGTKSLGAIIVPDSFLTVGMTAAEIEALTKKLDYSVTADKIFAEGGYYYANIVVVNVKYVNLNLKYNAVGYIKDTATTPTIYTPINKLAARDVVYIASSAKADTLAGYTPENEVVFDRYVQLGINSKLGVTETIAKANFEAGTAPTLTVNLNKTETTMLAGKAEILTAVATPEVNLFTKWSSSNEAVATVSDKGEVTAKTAGEATITVEKYGASATCVITVTPESTNSVNEGYESEKSLEYVTGTADDKWTWPTTISAEQHHTGAKSLKITPHATDGTWPNMVFSSGSRVYFDLTDKDIISVWVYNSSAAIMKGMGLKVNNGEGVNQAIKTFDLPSKTWTEISITKTEILALASAINLKEARISFLNAASDYKDRSNIYLDDFTITVAEKDVSDGNTITFEKPTDIDKIGANADDIWTWPTTISAEQHHTGEKSLKITTRQDGGVWPNVVFKYKNLDTFDLTNLDKISLWVYFDSANAVTTLGFKIKNQTGDAKAEKTFNIASKTWTEITFSKAEIVALSTTLDLSKSIISFSQLGGTYEDRANFYLDDFAVILKQS